MRRVAAAALLLAAPVVTASAQGAAPTPVLDQDFADPFILPVGPALVAFATNTRRHGHALNVQVSQSRDGQHWDAPIEAMPDAPRWARADSPNIWAPEVAQIGDHYVLYFSARHRSLKRSPHERTLCVGAAISDHPEGPFLAQPQPLTCGGPLGAIDASPARIGEQLWLYVKTDGNCCKTPVHILAQPLSPDGLHLSGTPTAIEGMTNDRAWEGAVIEAPEMRTHAGKLYMFFAGGDYGDAHYALGFARCASPTGPCEQAPENPILASRAGLLGPGHECVFHWQGRDWIAFAAWRDRPQRHRAMYIAPLEWDGDRPVVALAKAPAS